MSGGRNLPYHELLGMQGLQVNLSPRTVVGQGLRVSKNFDGFSEFRAIGVIPGSEIINQGTVVAAPKGLSSRLGSIESLHYFEYFDYDETSKKKLLAVAQPYGGGAPELWDVELSTTPASQTVTSVATVDVDGLYFQAVMNNRLHLSSPRALQGADTTTDPVSPTGGVKYDGTIASRWGVVAPGAEAVTLLAASAAQQGDWTVGLGSSVPTADQAANSRRFSGSIGIIPNVLGPTLSYTAGGGPFDWDPNGEGVVYVWAFIPPGTLRDSTFSLAVTFTDNLAAFDTAQFFAGDLVTGWNLLAITAADVPLVDLTIITGIDFTLNNWFATGEAFLFNHIHTTDRATCTLAATSPSATTGVVYPAGEYTARVTYLTEYGLESNAGDISNAITVGTSEASGDFTFNVLPLAADTVTVQGDSGPRTYTFVAALSTAPTVADEILIGPSTAACAENLYLAIEGDDVARGSQYSLGTVTNAAVEASATGTVVTITAVEAGTAGNAYPLAESTAGARIAVSGATLAGGADSPDITITNIPIAAENGSSGLAAGIIARRIYLDLNGDVLHRFAAQIDDNTTTTLTLNAASGALGTATPPLAADPQLDNSPPQPFGAVEVHLNRVFGALGERPTTLSIGDPGEGEIFPLLNEVVFNKPITALQSALGGLLVFTSDEVYIVEGNGSTNSPFFVTQINDELGANGPRSVGVIRGDPFVIREREVFTGQVRSLNDPWYLSGPLQAQFNRDWNLASLDDGFVINDRSRFRMLVFQKEATGAVYPGINPHPGTFNQIYSYQYGTMGFSQITGDGAGTDPQDPRVGAWHQMWLPDGSNNASGDGGPLISPRCAAVGERGSELPEVWVGSAEGFIHQLQPPGASFSWNVFFGATSQILPANVSAEITYNDVPLGTSTGGRGDPRFIKLNITNNGSGAAAPNILISVYDEPGMPDADYLAQVSFAVTGGIPAGETASLILPVPELSARGEWCRVNINSGSFSATSANLTIHDAQLFFIPRGVDFSGPRNR